MDVEGEEKMSVCRHVYQVIGKAICPDCGGDTHESDFALQRRLHDEWIKNGKDQANKCPLGGTIRGWWDI